MSRIHRLALLGLLALVPTLPSCLGRSHARYQRLEVHHYMADPQDLAPVQRVMVLPFAGRDHARKDIRQHVTRGMTRELTAMGRFQVVPLPHLSDEETEILESETSGILDSKELVDLARRFHLDGVLLGKITTFQEFSPPRIGLRTVLVSVHSGGTIWAVDQVFDARKELVRLDALRYYERVLIAEASNHGGDMMFLSPRLFSDYAIGRVVGTLED